MDALDDNDSVFNGGNEDEEGNAEGWVDKTPTGKLHNNSADEDREPFESIEEHMKIDGFYIVAHYGGKI